MNTECEFIDVDISFTGPNGPLIPEIVAMHPTAPYIKRQGVIDAWDDPNFRAAVQATGKQQLILAGITTDVRSLESSVKQNSSRVLN